MQRELGPTVNASASDQAADHRGDKDTRELKLPDRS